MELTTANPGTRIEASAGPLLLELPPIADIVWAIVARVRGTADPVRLVFAPAQARSGNTVIAAATAIAIGRHLRVPVGLVETNVERPALASYLGLRNAGVSDLVDGRARLEECLQTPRDCAELTALPAGTPRVPLPGDLVAEAMRSALETLGKRVRYLVLDAPPLLTNLESRLLLQQAHGTVLVLNSRSTDVEAAARAQRIAVEGGAPVLGSIFNVGRVARGRSLFGSTPVQRPPATQEKAPVAVAPPANGEVKLRTVVLDRNGASEPLTDEEHRREIDKLERRIAKLTLQLEQAEAAIRHLAKLKNVDPGIASIYRTVQGLSPDDEARESKSALLTQIFEANVELRHTMERRRRAAQGHVLRTTNRPGPTP
jgi:MinD-like ATPase involved in chromosome partitioning or flagellar assembly